MIKKEITEWIKAAIFALIFYIIINVFIFSARVDGASMYPTLNDDDFLISLKGIINNDYKYGDIVVFSVESRDYLLIKRIIGLPGDHIEIKQGNVYRNGTKLNEPYIDVETDGDINQIIEEGNYFVLGDNRGNSADSRVPEIGQIGAEDIKGKILFRLYPLPEKFN